MPRRAATERLVLGCISAGAGGSAASDLAQATAMAVRIDTRFGLGAEGPVWLGGAEASYLRDPDNATRIRDRLEAAEARAMQVLGRYRGLLKAMAADLEEHRMLEGDKLTGWVNRVRNKWESGDRIQPVPG